jgi:hypothetical protein
MHPNTEAKKAKKELKAGRMYVCPRMKAGKTCDGSNCRNSGNGSSSGGGNAANGGGNEKFRHPPVCKDPEHNVPKSQRPASCVLWHLRTYPNANGGAKGKSNGTRYKNGNIERNTGTSRGEI